MGSRHEAIRHLIIIDEAIAIFIQLVEHNEHFVFGYGLFQILCDGVVEIVAVNTSLAVG